jgi:hypothetical protein
MFAEDNNSAQIDNKVLSFVLLVTGRNDVLVFDRVQFRHFWDAQRYQQAAGTGNIYDGIAVSLDKEGKPNKSGLQPMGEAVQGLALYEAMERNLLQPIQQAYQRAGIQFDGIGSFHWDSWLAISGQAISHPTTELLLATPDTKGVEVSQGKYDETKYGLIYRFGGDFFLPYLDKPGGRILTARETDAIKIENLRKAGVVPESKKLKSDAAEERLAPWTEDPDVDRGAYNRWAATLGVEAPAEGGRAAPDGTGGRADVGRGKGPRVSPSLPGGPAPTRGAPGHTQVFGRREGPVREPGFFEPVVEVIKDRFFDSRIPVTAANAKIAFDYVTVLLDPVEGKKTAQAISAAITNPEDKNLGVGVLHTELMKYAAKVSGETGNATLFDYLQNNLNDIVIDDSGKTFRDYGQTVAGRSTYTLSGFMKAVKEVTDSRDEAMAKAIPEEVLDDIDKTVRGVEVTEEMMTGVGTKPRKKGKTGGTTSVEEMVEEAIPVTPRRKTKRTILKEILAEPEPEPEVEPEAAPVESATEAGAEVLPPETPGEEIATLPVPVEAEFVPKEKFGDDIIRYADQKAAEIREKIRKMLSERTSMGVDPTLIPLAVEYGALKLLKGGIKFTQWAAEMKSELGAWIDDIDMIDVWNKATARVKKFETTTAAPAPAPTPTPTEPGAAPTPKPKPPSKPRKTTAKPKPTATETEGSEEVEEVEEPEEEKPEVSAEDKTAQKYIDRVDESQVEILKPDAIENPVLKYIRAQEEPPFTKSKDDFVISATRGLEDLGVSTGVARETAERIWLRKEARRDAAVRRTEKTQKEATTKAAQSFISTFDKSQTEVVLPAKETNPAVKILRSAQKLEGDISKEDFINSVRDELIGVGVEKGVAVNAASRAWAIRETKVKKAEARIQKRAEARNLSSAEKILNDFARLQSDTLSWTKKKLDPVRDAVRRAMSPKNRFVKSAFQAELVRLGVEPAVASSLAETVARQKEINGRIATDELSKALATGAKGTLKPLEEILVAATPAQQRDPDFRKRQEIAYFTQLGLTAEQAAAAARLYDKEFTERLGEAIDSAINRQAETSAPWQQRMRKGSPALKKKMVTGLDRVKKAIRSGLLDPSKNWKNDLAELNGWKGFTPEQYKRMSEIDDELSRPDIMDYESAKLIAEMNDIIARAKIPETPWNQALSSYVAGVLSGLSTINVQFSAHTGLVRDFLGDLPTDPVMATKALLDAMGNVFSETKFALKNNVYTHNVDEHMKGHEQPLRQMFESGLKQLQSKKATDKAMGYWKVFVGAQLYMTRVLNSLDQGFITTAQVYKTTLFTHRALQQLGMSRADAAGLIEEAMRAKAEAIENATEKGMDGEEAVVRGNEIFLKEMYEVVAKQGPEGERLAEDIKIGAARESVGTVGRLSSDVTPVRLKTGGGGEGFLSTPINAIIDTINRNLLEHGGTEALKARMMFGFVTIPFRTARWYAGYSPYGFVRYFNHWRYERAGRTSPYQQSYGKESQVRQRLRDATLGTLLMAAAAAFAAGTGDDDPEKEEFKFFITGKGPRDKTLRDVWMKRFKPYALVVKVGKSYVPLNLGRAFESLSWGLAFAGALDDIRIKQKGQEARNPLKDFKTAPELLGSYFGSLSQRSSFQGLNKIAAIGEGVNSERTAIDVANVGIFAASGFVPWKGALNSVTRLFTNPIDRNSIMGAIHANTPIIGPLAGRIALNTFGDPMGDQTIAGRLYAAGVPVTVRFPAGLPNEKAYDVVMKMGRGPAPARRNDIEKIYGPVPDEQFYEFSKIRGQALKKAMSANAAKLMAMDQEEYGEWVENISRAENPKAAKAVGMVKPPKK